jgi:two-component system, chemotaxis family, response regulator Rcp1
VRLLEESLGQLHISWRLHIATDGETATRRVQELAATGERPDLILLDLNLPKKSGHEVLKELKHDTTLHRIPVIVFSSSRAEPDVRAAYDGYANCYISKPSDFDGYSDVIRTIEDFWHSRVELPPPDDARSNNVSS